MPMTCRFKGTFTDTDRERITTAAHAVERLRGTTDVDPSWAFLGFNVPYSGYRFWGVRLADGHIVRAHTATGLAVTLRATCEEMLRLRSRALQDVSHRATDAARSA
jgi:hypothetical protein